MRKRIRAFERYIFASGINRNGAVVVENHHFCRGSFLSEQYCYCNSQLEFAETRNFLVNNMRSLFKCQKWTAGTLADRSCIPFFSQRPKTRWASSIWSRHSHMDGFTIGFPIVISCIIDPPLTAQKDACLWWTSWLQMELAHRVFGLWEKKGIQLRSARTPAFHFWHLKVRSCNNFDAIIAKVTTCEIFFAAIHG